MFPCWTASQFPTSRWLRSRSLRSKTAHVLSCVAVGGLLLLYATAANAHTPDAVMDLSPDEYQVVNLMVGDKLYIDKSYTAKSMPAALEGLVAIRTRKSDGKQKADEFVTFTIEEHALLYVAYDAGASPFPRWLTDDYTNTGMIIDSVIPLVVWRRLVSPGTISIPGNRNGNPGSVSTNYIVLFDFHPEDTPGDSGGDTPGDDGSGHDHGDTPGDDGSGDTPGDDGSGHDHGGTPGASGGIVNECPSNTTKVEVQSWWVPNFGHIHATACYPLLRQFSGSTMSLNVRVVLHHNPGHLFKLRFDDGSGGLVADYPLNLGCVYDETCAFNVPVQLPVSRFRSSGLRIRASVDAPDGKRYVTSSDLPIAGGATDNIQGKGWYDGIGYAIARIHPDSVPMGPVSGTHVFRVATKKASDMFTATLDASHGIPAARGGFWLAEPANEGKDILVINGGNTGSWINVPVDTTKLANGWHTIAFNSRNPEGTVSQCDEFCHGERNHLHGILKLWFFVQN